jgi:hypothetical protein
MTFPFRAGSLPVVREDLSLERFDHELEQKLEEYFEMRQSLTELKLLRHRDAFDLMWLSTSYASLRDHSLLRRVSTKATKAKKTRKP